MVFFHWARAGVSFSDLRYSLSAFNIALLTDIFRFYYLYQLFETTINHQHHDRNHPWLIQRSVAISSENAQIHTIQCIHDKGFAHIDLYLRAMISAVSITYPTVILIIDVSALMTFSFYKICFWRINNVGLINVYSD